MHRMPDSSPNGRPMRPVEFPDLYSAKVFLRRFLTDQQSHSSLRRTLRDEYSALDISRLRDDEIVNLVANRMVSGHIRLGRVPLSRAGVGQAEPPEKEEEVPVEAAAAAALVSEPHWIEVIFEDAAGNPLPDIEYVFQKTDRTKEDGKTGADGRIRYDDIPDGSCNVELKEVTVVSWSRSGGKPDDEIGFKVETSGFAGGTAAKVEVFELYRETGEDVVATIDGSLADDGSFAGRFRYADHAESHEPSGRRYAKFILKATVGADWRKSDALRIELKNLLNARWSVEAARSGETVELVADAPGYADGTPAEFTLWERDWVGEDDPVDAEIESDGVADGQVRAQWTYEYIEDDDDVSGDEGKGYNPPEYYFRVKVGDHEARSKLLRFRDVLEVVIHDDRGSPATGVRVFVKGPDGSRRSALTDSGGEARFEDVPPGKFEISLDGNYASLRAS